MGYCDCAKVFKNGQIQGLLLNPKQSRGLQSETRTVWMNINGST